MSYISTNPPSFRFSKPEADILESLLAKESEGNPGATLIWVIEKEVADFGFRMQTAVKIRPNTTDLASLHRADATLAAVARLLEASIRNGWPLHTRNRSPKEDGPKLETMHRVVSQLEPAWKKCHAAVNSTTQALRWMRDRDLKPLRTAVDALARDAEMTDDQVHEIQAFACGLGLRVRSPFAPTFQKALVKDKHHSFRFSVQTLGWLEEIAATYNIESRSAALRFVVQNIGKQAPLLIIPSLSAAHDGGHDPLPVGDLAETVDDGQKPGSELFRHLETLGAWHDIAAIALRNGRSPAVPTETPITTYFDKTYQGALRMLESHKEVSGLCTAITSIHLDALTRWCRGERLEGTRRAAKSFFQQLDLVRRDT